MVEANCTSVGTVVMCQSATSSCVVELLETHSKKICVAGRNFGCHAPSTRQGRTVVWTRECRGNCTHEGSNTKH